MTNLKIMLPFKNIFQVLNIFTELLSSYMCGSVNKSGKYDTIVFILVRDGATSNRFSHP